MFTNTKKLPQVGRQVANAFWFTKMTIAPVSEENKQLEVGHRNWNSAPAKRRKKPHHGVRKTASDKELQSILVAADSTAPPPLMATSSDVCMINEGPFWILRMSCQKIVCFVRRAFGDRYRIQPEAASPIIVYRNWKKVLLGIHKEQNHLLTHDFFEAAENGNLLEFERLYLSDPTRLEVTDHRGRTATHQAAARNRVQIIDFIFNHGGDMNIKDNAGNTPLHVAIINDALQVFDYLLQRNVRTDIFNEKNQAAIHLITEQNKTEALQVCSKYRDRINTKLGGEHGRTALHLAAMHDHDECARILITELGACPRQKCDNGYYPIHEAAKSASFKTMEVFLQWGEARGCPREEMFAFTDSEGNVPLHSAVHGGDIRAVELCLKSGATISKQQHDKSTPVHLACAQGAVDIVRLMFKLQPQEKAKCLKLCDVQMMTPLHCAAMFDHPEIVQYLSSEGAEMNALDKENRSPLLLAASRTGWRTVHSLIRLGASIHLKDSNQRNVLTLIVMNGGRLEDFAEEIIKARSEMELAQLLNEKDIFGCSPLHYASREGHIRSLESLIRLGACINLKNNKNESPLHFAARYGRYNTVKQLLDSDKGTFIINESDGEGLTPLHIASKHGHTRVVQLLLNRGALLHRDHGGRNPLHLAAMSGYTQTMQLLHSVHSHLLDQTDKDDNAAIHLAAIENKPNSVSLLLSLNCKIGINLTNMNAIDYAIQYKHPDVVLAMVTHPERGPEILGMKSEKHPCVMLALIASMPKVFEAVLDRCIVKADCTKDSKSFYIKYNFSILQCPIVYAQVDHKTGETLAVGKPIPLPALNAMVSHGRVELLAHPLSQKYLQMKWHAYGKYFHLANLLFYMVFLAIVTTLSISIIQGNFENALKNTTTINSNNFNTTEGITTKMRDTRKLTRDAAHMTIATVIFFYVIFNTMREILQMYLQRWNYLLDPSNLVSWLLYISATTMILPIFNEDIKDYQLPCAAFTIFLCWFNLLLYLQRFDTIGIYVVMFLEILQTLIRVLLVFSILIIAFGLAFHILLSSSVQQKTFSTIPRSLMRTFTMMLEIDYVGTFDNGNEKGARGEREERSNSEVLAHPVVSNLMLVLFMVLMPFLLMNLLIGLAVGDIESVRRNAQLKRLAMQVILHTELERKLPMFFLARVDKMVVTEYPNDSKCKLGIMDKVLRKWFCNPFSENGVGDLNTEPGGDLIIAEMLKQKYRLKEITTALETQQMLLRLIVQKMEIKTEADDVDEGVSPNTLKTIISKWTSPAVQKKLRSAMSFRNTNY